MKHWTVILSNGENVKEVPGNFGSWRQLKHKCDKENLSIQKIFYENDEWKPIIMGKPPEFIFIIQDGLAVLSNAIHIRQDFRRGLGALSFEYNRYRIEWKDSGVEERNYNEVRKNIPSFYKEICIKYSPSK